VLKEQDQQSQRLGRTQPFLLMIGSAIYLVAENQPIIIRPPTLSVVFNVHYPKWVVVLYNFLQKVVLNLQSKDIT
jgi:hypothetical protein